MVLILEILRGLAALWVFVFHVRDNIFCLSESSFIYQFLGLGYLGVPMFFVISGYVITYSAQSHITSNQSPLVFLKKRLWRIYPTLWFSIVATSLLPIAFELLSFLKGASFTIPIDASQTNIQKYTFFEWVNVFLLTKIFWQEHDSLAAEFKGINTVYWSLAIEVQFYVVVSVLMFFKNQFKILILALSLLSFVSLFFTPYLNDGLFLQFWLPFSFGIL